MPISDKPVFIQKAAHYNKSTSVLGVAGAVVALIIYVMKLYGLPTPAEIVAPMTIVISAITSFAIRNAPKYTEPTTKQRGRPDASKQIW